MPVNKQDDLNGVNPFSDNAHNEYLNNRYGGSMSSNQPSSESLGVTDKGVQCMQVLDWEDPLDERPIEGGAEAETTKVRPSATLRAQKAASLN